MNRPPQRPDADRCHIFIVFNKIFSQILEIFFSTMNPKRKLCKRRCRIWKKIINFAKKSFVFFLSIHQNKKKENFFLKKFFEEFVRLFSRWLRKQKKYPKKRKEIVMRTWIVKFVSVLKTTKIKKKPPELRLECSAAIFFSFFFGFILH